MKYLQGLKEKFAKERFSFGLDIGSRAIKFVKLKFFKDTIELCAAESAEVQLDVSGVLKKFKHSFEVPSVNIGICGPATVIRYVEFPLMNKAELKQALRFEAQKHIPFSLNDVILDGHILKDNLPDNKMLVLVAAAKKEAIQQRLKLISEAGLRVNRIDIDSISLVNAFNHSYAQEPDVKNKVVGMLNIGSILSSLNILEDGVPRLSRDIHIAGNNFTQKIADAFGLDFKAAEELKRNPEGERREKAAESVESVLSGLAGEVRISFDYYESQSASSVSKIFLSGGGSRFSGLKEMLANLMGIEVQTWDPCKQIAIPDDLDHQKIQDLGGSMGVAAGLALLE
jgi:type IV pilus assembly protein PilM